MNDDQLSVLSVQIGQIMTRLDRIEQSIAMTPCAPLPHPVQRQAERKIDGPSGTTAVPPRPLPQPSPKSFNLVGIVAVLCFVLAGVFFVKLSIDNGWLTPSRQVIGAALAGILFIFAGYSLRERDQDYASFLPGAGVAIIFLALFGAHFHYGVLNDRATIVLLVCISIGCLKLYNDFKSDLYPLAATLGTYIIPVIFAEIFAQIFSIGVFYLLWACLFSILASTVTSRSLLLMASYFGIGGFSLLTGAIVEYPVADTWALIAIQSVQLLIFGVGNALYTAQHRSPMTGTDVALLSPLIVWFYGSTFVLVHNLSPALAPWMMVVLAVVIFGLYQAVTPSSEKPKQSSAIVEIFIGLTAIHSVYGVLLRENAQPLFAVVLGLAYFAFLKPFTKIPVWGLLIVGICLIEGSSVLDKLIQGSSRTNSIWTAYGILISAMLILVGAMMSKEKGSKLSHRAMLFTGHAFGVATLFDLLRNQGSFAVSVGWGIYALAVLAIGFNVKHQDLAKSSLYILLFSVGKVLLYDLSSADTVVRIFCLLLTGSLLYAHGFLLRRIATFK